jgi:hypothetical protein
MFSNSEPFVIMDDIVYTPSALCTTAGGRYIDAQQRCIIPGTILNEQTCNELLGFWGEGQCILAITLTPIICRILGSRYEGKDNTCMVNRSGTPAGDAVDTITVTLSDQDTLPLQDIPSVQGRGTLEGFLTAHSICEKVEHGSWGADSKVCTLITKDQTPAQCDLRGGKMLDGHCVLEMEAIANWCNSNGHTWKPSANTCFLTGIPSTPYFKPPTTLTTRRVNRSTLKELCQVLSYGTWDEISHICTLPAGSTKYQCDGRDGNMVDGRCKITRDGLIAFCNDARGTWDPSTNTCVSWPSLSSTLHNRDVTTGVDACSIEASNDDKFAHRQPESRKQTFSGADICYNMIRDSNWEGSTKNCITAFYGQDYCEDWVYGKWADGHCEVGIGSLCESIIEGCWDPEINTCKVDSHHYKCRKTADVELRIIETRDKNIDANMPEPIANDRTDMGVWVMLVFIGLTLFVILILGLGYLRQMEIETQHGFRYVACERVVIDNGSHYIVRDGISP